MGGALMFPGQGAQSPGMGAAWRGHAAWDVVTRAEDALGRSLEPLLVDSPLDHTEDAQLAILLVSLMGWEAAKAELEPPVAVAGHSLGQLTALIATGALGFEAGLHLAAERARLTQAAANRRPGRMAALLGASDEQVDAAVAAGTGKCWIANDNAPGQVVLAGTIEGVEAAVAGARVAGVRKVLALNVDGAFHTPLMDEARAGLATHLADVPLAVSSTPVVSNEDATPYTDADGWRTRLADHIVRPVRWRESVIAMVDLGAETLIEVGPGRTLAGMARRIVPDIPATAAPAPALEVTP